MTKSDLINKIQEQQATITRLRTQLVICEEENDVLKQQVKTKYIVNKQYEELQRLKKQCNEQQATINKQKRRIEVLENLLTNMCVKWVDDDG